MYLVRSSRGAFRAPVGVRDSIHAAEAAAEAAAAVAAAAPAAAPAAAAFVSELKEFDHKFITKKISMALPSRRIPFTETNGQLSPGRTVPAKDKKSSE